MYHVYDQQGEVSLALLLSMETPQLALPPGKGKYYLTIECPFSFANYNVNPMKQ